MRFTIEQAVMQKMLTRATRLLPKKSRLGYAVLPRPVLLKACAGWVFIEGPDSMAVGREALVLQDGSCVVDIDRLLPVIRTYAGVPNLTFEAGDGYLQFRNTRLPSTHYRDQAEPPGRFAEAPFNDTWLVSSAMNSSSSSGFRRL